MASLFLLPYALIASVSGCAIFDKDDEAVLAAAEDYATAIYKGKGRRYHRSAS